MNGMMTLTIREHIDLFATWATLLRRRYQVPTSVSLPTLVKRAVSEITKDEAQKMFPANLEEKERAGAQ